MPPLPPQNDPLVAHLPDTPKSAYIAYILPAEADAVKTSGEGSLRLMWIRILGALLICAPNGQACRYMASEITAAMNDHTTGFDKLEELGRLYYDHFIRLFKKSKVRTPTPSSHPSRPSFDRQLAWVKKELVQTPKDHSTAKKNALIRDGFRCMLTKSLEYSTYKFRVEALGLNKNTILSNTQCSHIMPDCTNDFNSVKDRSGKAGNIVIWAAGVWTLLNRFGYDNIQEELKGSAAHSLGNILTLDSLCHTLFDNLDLWLEAVPGKEHTYNVRVYPPDMLENLRIQNPVRFTVHNIDVPGFQRPAPAYLPLPNPRYLEIHAACCRVAHMSGAAEYLDTVLRDVEEIGVLAEDGGSADVLYHALTRLPLVAPG